MQTQLECIMEIKNDTIIQIVGLKPGSYAYKILLDGAFFSRYENDDFSDGEVVFEVIVEKTAQSTVINLDFKGTVKGTCDRCLGEMAIPVEGKGALLVKFGEEADSDNEDTIVIPSDATSIDLAQWMYEYVIVSLPMQRMHPEDQCDPEMVKYLHKESDEPEQKEIDPRWEVLKQLKEE